MEMSHSLDIGLRVRAYEQSLFAFVMPKGVRPLIEMVFLSMVKEEGGRWTFNLLFFTLQE